MSSTTISWTDIRRAMGDPLSAQLKGLINKQNAMVNQITPISDLERARGIGRATYSKLTYRDPFTWGIIKDKAYGENPNVVNLDGVNDYIALGTHTDLWNQPLTKYSFSLWFQTDSIAGGTYRRLVDFNWGSNHSFLLYYYNNLNRLYFEQIGPSWSTRVYSGYTLLGAQPSDIGNWINVIVVYDSTLLSGIGKIYINGVNATVNITDTPGNTVNSATNPLTISKGTSEALDGRVQNFKWWTNQALSQSDVNNEVAGRIVIDPSYWLYMDEGTGNPKDRIGGSLTGVLTNGAAWQVVQPAFSRFFRPPMEPDGKYLTCWIPMKSLGVYLKDISLFRNHAYMKGIPLMCKGPDDGTFGGRIALEFNHSPDRDDYLYILSSPLLNLGLALTGMSVFARVKFNSLETPSGGIDATVFQKTDDILATSGFALRYSEDGRLKWFTRRSSVTRDHITAADTIDIDTIYDIGCRFKVSDNTMQLHMDGVSKSDVTSESMEFPENDASDLRLCIGDKANAGRAQVTFYDFRLYYEYLISTAEWGHLFVNKRSISDIPYGLVAAEGITRLQYNPPFTYGYSGGFTH